MKLIKLIAFANFFHFNCLHELPLAARLALLPNGRFQRPFQEDRVGAEED